MQAIYLLNENPIFYGMFSISVRLLKKYNPNIEIKLFYIQDKGQDSWKETRRIQSLIDPEEAKKYLITNKEQLVDLCKKLNIEIEYCENLGLNQNYTPLHRHYLKNISSENCLLLDVDTFILKEIDFSDYKDFDFVAHPMMSFSVDKVEMTKWIFNYFNNGLKKVFMSPFNSGVVFWNNGWIKKYGEQVLEYCNKLKYKKHPMSSTMYTLREDGRNREEVACTLFVLENDLKWTYFNFQHVQTFNLKGETSIFHTTSIAWPHYFNFFAKQGSFTSI